MGKMHMLLALLSISSMALAQLPYGNLGGGCVDPQSYMASVGFVNDPLQFYSDNGKLGVLGMIGPSAQDPCVQLLMLGLYDPNGSMPSCGCILHTSSEVTIVLSSTGDVILDIPPAASGATIFAQCAYVPLYANLPQGCTEVWIEPVLSDGYWLTLP